MGLRGKGIFFKEKKKRVKNKRRDEGMDGEKVGRKEIRKEGWG